MPKKLRKNTHKPKKQTGSLGEKSRQKTDRVPNQRLEISSAYNDFFQFSAKYLTPVFLILFTIAVSAGWIFQIERDLIWHYKWPLIPAALVLGWSLYNTYTYAIHFKKVQIDRDFLYVSNFRKEIVIPRLDILKVSTTWMGYRFTRAVIELNKPSAFGIKIYFLIDKGDLLPSKQEQDIQKILDANFP